MSKLFQLISRLMPRVQSQRERDEAYLNDSVDIHDLERRMREIDSRASTLASGLRHGQVFN